MLSFEVATTPPEAARARMPDTAEGVEPLKRREYSGMPMKLVAFNTPGRFSAEGPREAVEGGLGLEVCLEEEEEEEEGRASEGADGRDQAEAMSIILPTTDTSSSCLRAWRSCSSSWKMRSIAAFDHQTRHAHLLFLCFSFQPLHKFLLLANFTAITRVIILHRHLHRFEVVSPPRFGSSFFGVLLRDFQNFGSQSATKHVNTLAHNLQNYSNHNQKNCRK